MSHAHWHSGYLVEWKSVHIAQSATAYAELLQARSSADCRSNKLAQIAAFGDPTYPDASALKGEQDQEAGIRSEYQQLRSRVAAPQLDFKWPSLPYSRREIEGIGALFSKENSQIYTGSEALEEKVKSLDPGIRILHLAAHALADEHLPLNSFVALTIPEAPLRGGDNGLLQAWEVMEQVTIDADLVVLSGCFTGMGKELRGEGMIGLTRAFHYAGARSMMSTLWNVDDQAQAELMIRFYRHLRAGKTKDEALRAAQIQMIREPIMSVDLAGNPMLLENASAPFYWAGVQLYGDWQ